MQLGLFLFEAHPFSVKAYQEGIPLDRVLIKLCSVFRAEELCGGPDDVHVVLESQVSGMVREQRHSRDKAVDLRAVGARDILIHGLRPEIPVSNGVQGLSQEIAHLHILALVSAQFGRDLEQQHAVVVLTCDRGPSCIILRIRRFHLTPECPLVCRSGHGLLKSADLFLVAPVLGNLSQDLLRLLSVHITDLQRTGLFCLSVSGLVGEFRGMLSGLLRVDHLLVKADHPAVPARKNAGSLRVDESVVPLLHDFGSLHGVVLVLSLVKRLIFIVPVTDHADIVLFSFRLEEIEPGLFLREIQDDILSVRSLLIRIREGHIGPEQFKILRRIHSLSVLRSVLGGAERIEHIVLISNTGKGDIHLCVGDLRSRQLRVVLHKGILDRSGPVIEHGPLLQILVGHIAFTLQADIRGMGKHVIVPILVRREQIRSGRVAAHHLLRFFFTDAFNAEQPAGACVFIIALCFPGLDRSFLGDREQRLFRIVRVGLCNEKILIFCRDLQLHAHVLFFLCSRLRLFGSGALLCLGFGALRFCFGALCLLFRTLCGLRRSGLCLSRSRCCRLCRSAAGCQGKDHCRRYCAAYDSVFPKSHSLRFPPVIETVSRRPRNSLRSL